MRKNVKLTKIDKGGNKLLKINESPLKKLLMLFYLFGENVLK